MSAAHELIERGFEVEVYDRNPLYPGGKARSIDVPKTNLQRLLTRRPDGIFLADFEQGEIGPDLFRKACEFGLEGLVSKRADRPYRGGRSKDWIKVKNRSHQAFDRVKESFASPA